NPQDVGAHESETLFVSFDWAKQPEDLARAARSHEKQKQPFTKVIIKKRIEAISFDPFLVN
ncbi:hypothetical protein, partial [Guptibacillus hwajinpoensis]|uniref:hypothetical protein n=1 Tax=Guptibacillus hwajinpoensis TaxID=208199 RepID=UPI003D00317D